MRKGLCLLLFLFLISQLYAQDLGDVKRKYINGVNAIANSDLAFAESNFIYIINLPDSKIWNWDKYKSKSYYFMGDIAFIRQDFAVAVSYYQIVVENYFNEDCYPRAVYKLGRTLVLNNNADTGIELLKDYVSKYGDKDTLSDSALYWIARGYVAKNDYDEAFRYYQLVLEKYPNTVLAYEIRNSMDTLNRLAENRRKTMGIEKNRVKTDEEIAMEKEFLEKMSKLLQIKQKLLEIKSSKLEILNLLKEENGEVQ